MKPIKQTKWAIKVGDSYLSGYLIANPHKVKVFTKEISEIATFSQESSAENYVKEIIANRYKNVKVVKVTTSTVYEIED